MSRADVVLNYVRSLAQSHGTIPRLTLNDGVAGVAYAAHILARASSATELDVAAADLMDRTERFCAAPEAFSPKYPDHHLAPFSSGSILHGPIGYRLIAALASMVAGRSSSYGHVEQFLDAAAKPYRFEEFAFGSAGPLWGISVLLRSTSDEHVRSRVTAIGRRIFEAFSGDERMDELGFAHGRAGVLYAMLAFSSAARTALPAGFRERLNDLACLADVTPRGVSWPSNIRRRDGIAPWPGHRESWCNGAAGFVPLWSLAFELLGDAVYRDLALKTAAYLVRTEGPVSTTLCCGAAGHAVALRYADRLEPGGDWARWGERMLGTCGTENLRLTEESHGFLQGHMGVLLGGEPWL